MKTSLIAIPDELNKKIEIYQAKKRIKLKKEAIIEMISDYSKTNEGKKLTQ